MSGVASCKLLPGNIPIENAISQRVVLRNLKS